jgi:hypothetical protein
MREDAFLTAFGPVKFDDVKELMAPKNWALVQQGIPYFTDPQAMFYALLAKAQGATPRWWREMERAQALANELARAKWVGEPPRIELGEVTL